MTEQQCLSLKDFRAVTDSMMEFTFNEQSLPDGQINTGPENRHA